MTNVVAPFKNDVQKVLEEISNDYTCDLICGVIRTETGWSWVIGGNIDNPIELKGYMYELLSSLDNFIYEEVE